MRRVLFLIIVSIWSPSLANAKHDDSFSIKKQGDLILGGLFPLHRRGTSENNCGEFQTMPGYHYMEAMLYAIDEINNDTSILPNITLGAMIYDSCGSQTIGAKMTKELITLTLVPPNDGSQLVGVIGPHSSDLSKVVADFLRVFEIPQISYGATANVLSDKSIYSYFFRTVPPDVWQAQVMADIVLELGWNYVITINSNGLYSEKGMEEFCKAAKDRGICIAMTLALPSFPSENDFNDLVRKLNLEPRARGVVLFTDQRDSSSILKALKRNPASKRFYWLASDSWGNNLNVAEGVEGYAEGAITVTQLNRPVPGFEEYFIAMNPKDVQLRNNSWFRGFWQSHFKCWLNGSKSNFSEACSGNESLSANSLNLAPIRTVVNAVYAMAHALNDSIEARCTVVNGSCNALKSFSRKSLVGYLRNTTFKDQATGEKLSFNKQQEILGNYSIFNFQKKKGKYYYEQVGVWELGPSARHPHGNLRLNTSALMWPNKNSTPPVSRCRAECERGQVRKRKDNHNISCCWNCHTCGSRDYIVNNTCLRCAYGYSPDANLTACMKLRIVHVMSKASSKAIIAVSVLGLISVIFVSVFFFKNSHVPLIKASSRELSGIILFGLALLFIFPWFLLAEPSRAVCVCQPLILGVALASCYAPLFMKILRIFRIFNSARKSASKPILVSPASQVLIAVSLIMIQFFFATTAFFPTMPVPVERESGDAREIFMECSIEKEVFASLLSYNMLLMALCTIVAFKTRKFPRNFNEAKYIGFTMYFTCFVWIIFFPFYLSSGNGLKRINWEASAVLFIGWITLIGLFAPKIALLYLGGQVSNKDQLAVTNNTVSEAAVVRVDCPVTPLDGRKNAVEKGDQDKPESSSAYVLQ